jgi:WD40 repeat protein
MMLILNRRIVCVFCLVLVSFTSYGQDDFSELLPHHAFTIEWDSEGNKYASGHLDGSIQIYEDNVLLLSIQNAHTDWVSAVSFSPDGSRIVTAGYDGNLRIWNVTNGNLVAEYENLGGSISVTWSPDGSIIWAIPGTGEDTIISADTNTDNYSVTQSFRVASSNDVDWRIDKPIVAFGGLGSDILLVDTRNYSVVRVLDATPDTDFFEPPNEFTTSIIWHPTANIVANGKINGWVLVWNLNSLIDNVPILSLPANNGATNNAPIPFNYQVEDIAFSDDGNSLSSISSDGTLRTWDLETGTILTDTNIGETILSAAFSPDGSKFVYNTYSLSDMPPVIINLNTFS